MASARNSWRRAVARNSFNESRRCWMHPRIWRTHETHQRNVVFLFPKIYFLIKSSETDVVGDVGRRTKVDNMQYARTTHLTLILSERAVECVHRRENFSISSWVAFPIDRPIRNRTVLCSPTSAINAAIILFHNFDSVLDRCERASSEMELDMRYVPRLRSFRREKFFACVRCAMHGKSDEDLSPHRRQNHIHYLN